MANRFARKAGNWNASDVWSDTAGGTAGAEFVPTTGDVAMANSFAVAVNVSATCAQVRTDTTGSATAGGGFTLADGVTLTANAYAGTSACVTFSAAAPATASLVGHSVGGSADNIYGTVNSGSGMLTITGNMTGGTGRAPGVGNTSSGTLIAEGTASSGSGSPSNDVGSSGAHNSSSGTVTLTGDVFAGTSHGVVNAGTASGNFAIIGNATGGTAANSIGANNRSVVTLSVSGNVIGGTITSAFGANNASAGTLTIGGNATGGSVSTSFGANNASTGTLTIGGNATGGFGVTAYGANNNSTGTLTIGGNATGGSVSTSCGATNYSGGTLTIGGNATGGSGVTAYGANNNSTGTLTIGGNATGGSGVTAYGAYNNSTGTLTIQGLAIGNNYPHESILNWVPGVVNANVSGVCRIGGMKSGTGGVPGVLSNSTASRYFFASGGAQAAYLYDDNEGTLINLSASVPDHPAITNVRNGVSYNQGSLVGTCHVPPAANVQLNIPVDNTVGSLVVSFDASAVATAVWEGAPADLAAMETRLEATATLASVGAQLAAALTPAP